MGVGNPDSRSGPRYDRLMWSLPYLVVKRILRKHGYPPDKQEKATRTVLEQAEVLSEH